MADPLQALLASGAVPTTSFPPTSRYANVGVDAHDPGDGQPSDRRSCAGGCARGPSASRCSTRSRSSRATAATCSPRAPRRPRAVVADRRRQRRDRPARRSPRASARGCAITLAGRRPGRRRCLTASGSAFAGPAIPVPAPREVIEALQRGHRASRAPARCQSGFELTFEVSNRSPLQTLFLLTAAPCRSRSCASSSR